MENLFQSSKIEKKFLNTLKSSTSSTVSFDIFDTLLLRKCNNPNYIFELVGNKPLVTKYFQTPYGFAKTRLHAERRVS